MTVFTIEYTNTVLFSECKSRVDSGECRVFVGGKAGIEWREKAGGKMLVSSVTGMEGKEGRIVFYWTQSPADSYLVISKPFLDLLVTGVGQD